MTEEQIIQNAEKYAGNSAKHLQQPYEEYKLRYDAYIEGAHSRDKEIWTLKGLLKISEQEIKQLRTPAWISAHFMLPGENQKVFFRKRDCSIYYGWYDEKMQSFFTIDPDNTKWTINGVTHWMLIPKLV